MDPFSVNTSNRFIITFNPTSQNGECLAHKVIKLHVADQDFAVVLELLSCAKPVAV